MKRSSKRTRAHARLGFLKFIFCSMYLLSFKFFRLRAVGQGFTIFLSFVHLPPPPLSFIFPLLLSILSCLLSLSSKLSDFCIIWTVASALRYASSFVVLDQGNPRRCLPRPASSNIARCGTLIEPVDSSGFSRSCAGNLGRSHCSYSRPIKTSRKLNIMRQILRLSRRRPSGLLRFIILFSTFLLSRIGVLLQIYTPISPWTRNY